MAYGTRIRSEMDTSRDVEPWGWESFFTELARFIHLSERQYNDHPNEQYAEYAMDRLTVASRNIAVIREQMQEEQRNETADYGVLISVHALLNQLDGALSQLTEEWQQRLDTIEARVSACSYQAPLQPHSAAPGHPRFRITREQLEYLRSLSFSWTDIPRLLGVSRMTIHRRRDEYGLLSEPAQAITDAQLGQIVRDLRTELPDIGQVMVAGQLRAMGYRLPSEQIREAVQLIP